MSIAANAPKILALVRKSRRWTQEELGKKLGFDKTQVSKFETGKRQFDLETLDSFVQALELPYRQYFRLLDLYEEAEELTKYATAQQVALPFDDLRELSAGGRDRGEPGGWADPGVDTAARQVSDSVRDLLRSVDRFMIDLSLREQERGPEPPRASRRARRPRRPA